MRLVDLEEYKAIRKKVSLQIALTLSIPTFAILFLLSVAGGFIGAVLFGGIFGGLLFGTTYFIREITHKAMDRKREKIDTEDPVIDVIAGREMGLLEITPKALNFYNLTPGGYVKDFSLNLHENVELIIFEKEEKGLSKIMYRGIKRSQLVVRDLNTNIYEMFIYYDINGLSQILEDELHKTNTVID